MGRNTGRRRRIGFRDGVGGRFDCARRGQIVYPSIDQNCMDSSPLVCKSGATTTVERMRMGPGYPPHCSHICAPATSQAAGVDLTEGAAAAPRIGAPERRDLWPTTQTPSMI